VHQGQYVFAQLMRLLPWHTFRRLVHRYDGERYVKSFSCTDQFLAMALAQLSGRESLRDIETCLRAHPEKLFHLGFRSRVARSTLAEANATRDWRLYADFARAVIVNARIGRADDPLRDMFDQALYALDSTTVELCLSLYPWAPAMHSGCGGIKLHTLYDLHAGVPANLGFSPSRRHDVLALDELVIEPGAFYVMDRGYLDFARLFRIHTAGAHFLMRTKRHLRANRRCSHPVPDRTTTRSDQTIVLARQQARSSYPLPLRRLHLRDPAQGTSIQLLTNHFQLPAANLGTLYRHRWQIEIFFRWIKQHLRITSFYGTTPNAVKTQAWIAMTVYALLASLRRQLGTPASLHDLLQLLSVALFEKTPINTLLSRLGPQQSDEEPCKQLILPGY
jgi:hypothetical protein